MFEQYGKLAKEQYPDFDFSGWEIEAVMNTIHGFEEDYSLDDYVEDLEYIPFTYKLPKGHIGCVFVNLEIDKKMFFMINIKGTN